LCLLVGEAGKRLSNMAEDGDVGREQPLARRVEVVAVQVCDKRRVEPLDQPFGGQRQRHKRVPQRRLRILDRRPRLSVIERRVYEYAPPFDLEHQRCVTDERQSQRHDWVKTGDAPIAS